jgi:GNAT superfamily N-acetyltransferase
LHARALRLILHPTTLHVKFITASSEDDDAAPLGGAAEVLALYLDPEAVSKGVGGALLSHAVADFRQRGFRRATLWVLESNERARRFYEAAGWTPDGARKSEERPGFLLHEVRYQISL